MAARRLWALLDALEPGTPGGCVVVVLLLAAVGLSQDLATADGRWAAAICTWGIGGIAAYAAAQVVWSEYPRGR